MLERDLTRLAEAGPDVSLERLEQGVWAKVDRLNRLRRLERLSSHVQWTVLAATLITTMAIGDLLAQSARPPVLQISSAGAGLAPSTLLGPSR